MIAQWMLHALTVTTILTVAAIVAERALRLWKRQARLVWAGATALSVMIPLVSLARLTGLLAPAAPDRLPAAVGVLLAPIVVRATGYDVDVILALGWAAASVLLALKFVGAARWLAKRRASWHAIHVDGEHLFVSRDAGPAVVGFRTPTIVVPEWVFELDESLRALVLEHEREHRDRGDPRLLLATLIVAVALPWNLPLWYCLTRLRSAMELDCDLRVLRTYPDTRKYGSLLLAVAQRADRAGLLTAALTESNSLLGRRILAMRTPVASRRLSRTIALAAVAATLTVVACETQPPTTTKAAVTAPKSPGPVVASEPYFEFQVEEPVKPAPSSAFPRYPEMLRAAGVQGEVLVQFIVDREGRAEPQSLKILKSDHDLFTAAVRTALPQMQFSPARVGGKAVKQVVQQPFTFSMSR